MTPATTAWQTPGAHQAVLLVELLVEEACVQGSPAQGWARCHNGQRGAIIVQQHFQGRVGLSVQKSPVKLTLAIKKTASYACRLGRTDFRTLRANILKNMSTEPKP